MTADWNMECEAIAALTLRRRIKFPWAMSAAAGQRTHEAVDDIVPEGAEEDARVGEREQTDGCDEQLVRQPIAPSPAERRPVGKVVTAGGACEHEVGDKADARSAERRGQIDGADERVAERSRHPWQVRSGVLRSG